MPAISVSFYHKDEQDPHPELEAAINQGGILLESSEAPWNAILVGGGMASGRSAVILWIPTDKGVVLLQTSLAAWRAATVTMASAAEARWGEVLHD